MGIKEVFQSGQALGGKCAGIERFGELLAKITRGGRQIRTAVIGVNIGSADSEADVGTKIPQVKF